jgi:hypothetical protein
MSTRNNITQVAFHTNRPHSLSPAIHRVLPSSTHTLARPPAPPPSVDPFSRVIVVSESSRLDVRTPMEGENGLASLSLLLVNTTMGPQTPNFERWVGRSQWNVSTVSEPDTPQSLDEWSSPDSQERRMTEAPVEEH